MEFDRLIQQPESLRDTQWESDFLQKFLERRIRLDSDQPKPGPDGWPFLFARTTGDGTEPVPQVLQWLSGRGIGLVVNAHKMMPDYVFTYGMIWNFIETGRFSEPEKERKGGEVTFSSDQKMIFGEPSAKYLPKYVRAVMREFLTAQGFGNPKVLVATTADYKDTDLILSLDSIGGLPQNEHRKFAEMMSWFLPLHYSFVLANEAGLPSFYVL